MLNWTVTEAIVFVALCPIVLSLANTIGAFLDDRMIAIYRRIFK